jgi:hypothetical protein
MPILPIHQNSGDAGAPRAFDVVENAVADVDDLFTRRIRGAHRLIENARIRFFNADDGGYDEERKIVMDANLTEDVFQIGRKIREDAEPFPDGVERGQRRDHIVEQRFEFAALKAFADSGGRRGRVAYHAEPAEAFPVKLVPERPSVVFLQADQPLSRSERQLPFECGGLGAKEAPFSLPSLGLVTPRG